MIDCICKLFKLWRWELAELKNVEDTKISILPFTSFLFQSFSANTDNSSPVTITFPKPVRTQFIRIRPKTWSSHCILRFEVLGCPGKKRLNVFFYRHT